MPNMPDWMIESIWGRCLKCGYKHVGDCPTVIDAVAYDVEPKLLEGGTMQGETRVPLYKEGQEVEVNLSAGLNLRENWSPAIIQSVNNDARFSNVMYTTSKGTYCEQYIRAKPPTQP